jgi:hypothetical protein
MSALKTQEKVNLTWEHCVGIFGFDRCISLTLHGSQNYELDLPDSDVDTKLIIAPTWDEVINCKQPLSKTIDGPYGDINVVDIRLFIGVNLRKQNFNFLECLFTPYSCVNPDYADLWNELLEHKEEIAHFRPQEAIRTMMGQVENQWRRWGRFDDKKTLYHMMRISGAIERYQQGLAFADTLIPENQPHIMQVRLGKIGQEDMEYMFKLFYDHAHYLVEETEYKGPECPGAEYHMNQLQARFVGRALYEKGVFE